MRGKTGSGRNCSSAAMRAEGAHQTGTAKGFCRRLDFAAARNRARTTKETFCRARFAPSDRRARGAAFSIARHYHSADKASSYRRNRSALTALTARLCQPSLHGFCRSAPRSFTRRPRVFLSRYAAVFASPAFPVFPGFSAFSGFLIILLPLPVCPPILFISPAADRGTASAELNDGNAAAAPCGREQNKKAGTPAGGAGMPENKGESNIYRQYVSRKKKLVYAIFTLKEILSAIMAINSELVGLPRLF